MSESTTVFKWAINNLERHIDTGIIFAVDFSVHATADSIVETKYDFINIKAPPAEGYTVIPYSEVTENQCISWVQAALGDEQVQIILDGLQKRIDHKKAPPTAWGMPWSVADESISTQ